MGPGVSEAKAVLQERSRLQARLRGQRMSAWDMCTFCCVTLVSGGFVGCTILNHCCLQCLGVSLHVYVSRGCRFCWEDLLGICTCCGSPLDLSML